MATLDEVNNSCVYNQHNLDILLSLNSDKNDFVRSLGSGRGTFSGAERIFRRIYEEIQLNPKLEGERYLVARAINLCFKIGLGQHMDKFNRHELSKAEAIDFDMLQAECNAEFRFRYNQKNLAKKKS